MSAPNERCACNPRWLIVSGGMIGSGTSIPSASSAATIAPRTHADIVCPRFRANPCKLVARNAVRSRERVLADSEVPLFWSAFGDVGLVVGAALKMILLTGQRPGEVAAHAP